MQQKRRQPSETLFSIWHFRSLITVSYPQIIQLKLLSLCDLWRVVVTDDTKQELHNITINTHTFVINTGNGMKTDFKPEIKKLRAKKKKKANFFWKTLPLYPKYYNSTRLDKLV
jgi:hypothetical protein